MAVATTGLVLAGAPPATADPSATCSVIQGVEHCQVTYAYTGAEQQFTVPAGVSSVSATAIGAAGQTGVQGATQWIHQSIGRDDDSGPDCNDPSATAGGTPGSGGEGAQVTGKLSVTAGQTLYVEVGGTATNTSYIWSANSYGGWNGGGDGGPGSYNGSNYICGGLGGGGGGASDIQTCSRTWSGCTGAYGTATDSRLIVAAGGAGGGEEAPTRIPTVSPVDPRATPAPVTAPSSCRAAARESSPPVRAETGTPPLRLVGWEAAVVAAAATGAAVGATQGQSAAVPVAVAARTSSPRAAVPA